MASETCMPDPMCLIENVKGQLRPNQKALEILSAITQPVVVVAIVGLYRTGKSYLMNKLAGKNTGECLHIDIVPSLYMHHQYQCPTYKCEEFNISATVELLV